MSVRRLPAGVLLALLAAAALAGCGLAPKGGSPVSETVSRGFGGHLLVTASERKVPQGQTVLGLLRSHARVSTAYGGSFVAAIDGVAGPDWSFYVNGVQATLGPDGTRVRAGDRVWWDLHPATRSIPAVVGSFPEPFVHGIAGRRYPTTLECGSSLQGACNRIGAILRADGVPVADQALGTGSGSDSLNIVVATWRQLRGSLAGDLISHGPASSGIFARFVSGGAQLQLLDAAGGVARTLAAGAGLIAATRDQVSQPEWLVTGTDAAGVRAAAAALTPSRLRDHFALAVSGGAWMPLPLAAP
jgi:hypothetical protein